LADKGMLIGQTGDYQLGAHDVGDALPGSIEAVLGARIDRLDESEKSVLQVGAIIGKDFPFAILEEVVGLPSGKIEEILERLRDTELIQEQATAAGRQFAFRHPLIQEVT